MPPWPLPMSAISNALTFLHQHNRRTMISSVEGLTEVPAYSSILQLSPEPCNTICKFRLCPPTWWWCSVRSNFEELGTRSWAAFEQGAISTILQSHVCANCASATISMAGQGQEVWMDGRVVAAQLNLLPDSDCLSKGAIAVVPGPRWFATRLPSHVTSVTKVLLFTTFCQH